MFIIHCDKATKKVRRSGRNVGGGMRSEKRGALICLNVYHGDNSYQKSVQECEERRRRDEIREESWVDLLKCLSLRLIAIIRSPREFAGAGGA